MKRVLILASFLIPLLGGKVLSANLSDFWATDGGYKQAKQDFLPGGTCSTCTITRTWDGTTISLFSGRGEVQGFALYMANRTGSDVTSVTVTVSSFTGPSSGGIVPVTVSSTAVMNWATRGPIETFFVRYLPIKGITQNYADPTEYEARQQPERFRRPYTVNGNNDGVPSGLWTDRRDHDKFYPDIIVPMEAYPSGFTVSKSSSQAVWIDILVSSSLTAGTYTGRIDVREGVTVSTSIPISLLVYNFILPTAPSFSAITYTSSYNINYRHQGEHFPSPGNVYQTTRDKYAQYFHRHKLAAMIGDNVGLCCSGCNQNRPCAEYVQRLNGTLYTGTSNYAGLGYGIGEPVYSIGTYGGWQSANWSASATDGATGFCTNVSNWSAYFRDNFPNTRAWLYLTDEPTDFTSTNKWSTWMATTTTCQATGSYQIKAAVTASLPALTAAPYINNPISTEFLRYSSATWESAASSYTTVGSTQMWRYNGAPLSQGFSFTLEADGIDPVELFWAYYKKHVQGAYWWEADYFTDSNNAGRNNDLFNDPLTFGYYTSDNTVKGRTGFAYSNSDGLLVYPGTDVIVDTANNYGWDGPIGSWRLKMMRRGIQDVDYLTMAYAVNPTSTTAIVATMVPKALWENPCFTLADCTYAYGDRSWTSDPNAWLVHREALAQTIVNGVPVNTSFSTKTTGGVKRSGTARVR